MDNQDQPMPGTEEFGLRTPTTVTLDDEGQAVTTVIENIRSGQFSLEAGALLSQLVNACVAQSSKGKLVIEIEVKAEEDQDWSDRASTGDHIVDGGDEVMRAVAEGCREAPAVALCGGLERGPGFQQAD